VLFVLLVLPGGLVSLWVRARDLVVRKLVPVDESTVTAADGDAPSSAAAAPRTDTGTDAA
jgi:hypothetical protein